jgi:mannitol/fructose-specific phosphotransferase system IIA component (Ntr-type)
VKLSSYLHPAAIRTRLTAGDKLTAIEELLDLLVRSGAVSDRGTAIEDLLARESKMSTGMEQGLAIPHAKTRAVKRLTVALGISPEGIEFQSLDGQPAQVIFLVLSEVGSRGPHIECLSEIASAYSANGTRNALIRARTVGQVMSALAGALHSHARR